MSRFAGLKADIERELKHLERLVRAMDDLLKKTSSGATEIELRAAGSLLHDFYTGLEKIFQRIALKVDQDLPAGGDWHLQLLQRMATPRGFDRLSSLKERLSIWKSICDFATCFGTFMASNSSGRGLSP